MPADEVERKLAAILSADVVGYSRLMAEDENETVRRLGAYRTEVTNLVGEHRGRVVDFTGDNFLAEFPTATDAVECAVEIQRVVSARNAPLPPERKMEFRVGIHMGEVRVEEDRLYGDGVNIAARLEGLAERGGICISATVHDQVRNKLDATYQDLGDQTVKNIPDQVRAYRVEPRAWQPEPRVEAPPAKRSRRFRTALLATGAVVLLVGVGLWTSWPCPLGLLVDALGVSGPPIDPSLPNKPSIVVLPFQNMSDDPKQEYVSDGITEDLTTELSRHPYLFVISRNSAYMYKGKRVTVEQVGRELGVRYVVEGSVRKSNDRLRITAQLIDATTGGHIWSERYDRDLSDIFALQSEISERIQAAVDVEIQEAEAQRLQKKPTESLTALDAYWKGGHHFLRVTREDNEKARRLFERAIELDPSYAMAYATLGSTYMSEFSQGWSSDATLLDRAEELARRAIALDPSVPNGHNALAFVHFYRGKSAEALSAAERAIELAPNFDFAHAMRGMVLAQEGRLLEATRSIRQALRLNPRAPTAMLLSVAYVNIAVGRREEALKLLERVRTANPDNVISRVALAVLYEQAGRHDDATATAREALRTVPDLTAEKAIELIPGLEQIISAEEFAQYAGHLRKAGLKE
jgi:adenylate cyclase